MILGVCHGFRANPESPDSAYQGTYQMALSEGGF